MGKKIASYSSRVADQFVIRFKDKETRPLIKELAAQNYRSMNGEILHLIEFALEAKHAMESAPESEGSEALISKTPISIKDSDNE